jgi:hypothetical protein
MLQPLVAAGETALHSAATQLLLLLSEQRCAGVL